MLYLTNKRSNQFVLQLHQDSIRNSELFNIIINLACVCGWIGTIISLKKLTPKNPSNNPNPHLPDLNILHLSICNFFIHYHPIRSKLTLHYLFKIGAWFLIF